MTPAELERYNFLHEQNLINLKLRGKRPATIQAYSRAVRRIAQFFDCCPDSLTKEHLKFYFASLVDTHSWSTVRLDRNGLQFFYHYVLDKNWEWADIVRPPHEKKVPDIITPHQVALIISTTEQRRYAVKPSSKAARSGIVLTAITMTDCHSLVGTDTAPNANTAPLPIGCSAKNRSCYPCITLW